MAGNQAATGGDNAVDETVLSPCVGVCRLDRRLDLCAGCLRSGREIAVWRDADDHLRRHILARIKARRAAGLHVVGGDPS